MNRNVTLRAAIPVTGLLLLLPQGPAGAAPAVVDSAAAPPAASVTINAPDVMRVDQQPTNPASVTFTGVSNKTRVLVVWGDSFPNSQAKGTCSVAAARKNRTGCAVTLSHAYTLPGSYAIVAASGKVRATKAVRVVPAPVRWTKPDGWEAPPGWNTLYGATFAPCQNVTWFLDPAGQPGSAAGIKSDIQGALDRIAAETGLTFTEAPSVAEANIKVTWRDLQGRGQGFQSLSPTGGSANLTWASDDPYFADAYGGFDTVHFVYTTSRGTIDRMAAGRGWVVAKYMLLALGLFPVSDTQQLVSTTYWVPGGFGAGDLDGLHTMYKNTVC